jgi:hypothetical protein
MDPLTIGDYLPKGWFSLKNASDGPLVMHFCSLWCIQEWVANEKNKIRGIPEPKTGTYSVAGEDLPKHSACYVDPSDGLAYRAKQKG